MQDSKNIASNMPSRTSEVDKMPTKETMKDVDEIPKEALDEAIDEAGFAVDTSDGAAEYLAHQAKQMNLERFDVLVVCNLIFHEKKILLIRLSDSIKAWSNKVGGPVFRCLSEGDHGLEGFLKSPIDKRIPSADDISVDEYARVSARTQVGLDPSEFRNSKAATALLTAVSPAGKLEDTNWLRAALFWTVAEESKLKSDGAVCTEAWWASKEDVEAMPEDDFYFGFKTDILKAFELRKV